MGGETLYDNVRQVSAIGIPVIEICSKLLLFQWPTHLSSLF